MGAGFCEEYGAPHSDLHPAHESQIFCLLNYRLEMEIGRRELLLGAASIAIIGKFALAELHGAQEMYGLIGKMTASDKATVTMLVGGHGLRSAEPH